MPATIRCPPRRTHRQQAVDVYALIVPASVPFVLLAAVLGPSWWEDHVLPSTGPTNALTEAPITPATEAQPQELPHVDITLTREGAGR